MALTSKKPLSLALIDAFKSNDAIALICDGKQFTYNALYIAAKNLANDLHKADQQLNEDNPSPLAIICDKQVGAYIAILACLLTSRTYIPIHPKMPLERATFIIQESGCKQIYLKEANSTDKERHQYLAIIEALKLISHQTIGADENVTLQKCLPPAKNAYIMYTSGSTGLPKGVPISTENLENYINNIAEVIQINNNDRCSQMFDLTFDLSVHDIVITWLNGASLYIPSQSDAFAPAKYITRNAITVWFSVPSTIDIMHRLKLLKPSAFPSIRLSLFCGEALSGISAENWMRATPNSKIINLYGPTEATIACCYYEVNRNLEKQPASIPIGKPFGNNTTQIKDGELLLGGPQVTIGYLNNPKKNTEAFDHQGNMRWYKSGDNVHYQPNQGLIHLGRRDDQVKINGHRIELQEISHTIKQAAAQWNVIALAHTSSEHEQPVIHLFIETPEAGKTIDQKSAIELQLRTIFSNHLIDYMRPKQIHWVDHFPLNSNGKTDKKALLKKLEDHHDAA